MTVADWLGSRTPAPPPVLRDRLRALLADAMDAPAADAPAACLAAGERVLERLLAEGCSARDAALDLLAADALVTYAFEAAAERPEGLERVSAEWMARIAAHAGPAA